MSPHAPRPTPHALRPPPPVVILCGGFGTRLRSVVADRPKALAPIGGEPFLGYLIGHVVRQGYTDIILSTGYLGEMVEEYAGDGTRWNARIRYAREPEPLGTGGALRFAMDTAGLDAPFLVLNGDTFFSGSLRDLVGFHTAKEDASASIALVEVARADRYGTVQAEAGTGRITAFTEKGAATAGPAWINAGAYVIAPTVLADLPLDRNVSLERDVFPRWIGHGLYGQRFPDAIFLDIGTPEDYVRAPQILR